VAVDRYRDGDRWNILISLRETKSRGDITDFRFERTVRDGFVRAEEWYQGRNPPYHPPTAAGDHLPRGPAMPARYTP
jgi:hypothetical protein